MAAGRGADAARAAPRAGRARRAARRRRRWPRPPSPQVHALLAARDRESARGLETFAGCPVKWLVEHVLKPAPVDPDPEAMRRGSLGHAVLERTLRGLQAAHRLRAARPRRRRTRPWRELHTAIGELIAAARTMPARAAARALEVDLERYIRHECATGAGYEPVQLEWSFDAFMIDGVAVSGRVDRVDTARPQRDHPRLQGPHRAPGRASGPRTARSRPRCTRSPCASSCSVEVVGALYQPIGTADQRPRGIVRDDVPGRYVNGDVSDGATLDAAPGGVPRDRRRSRRRPARGRIKPCPDRCGYQGGCAHPGICRGAMSRRTSPHEQLAAIEARTGSSLLAANAGSGKTAVMVERIAEAIRKDGVPVNAILALTFTEKAAGELAERLRRRLTELGDAENARAVDGAWIGTIHGFCARLLRSQPLAAGLDPRFEVLEETAAERLANAAYDDALEGWGRAHGAAAIDLAASYGPNLRDLIQGTYSTLRARGHARPRVQVPPRTRRARPVRAGRGGRGGACATSRAAEGRRAQSRPARRKPRVAARRPARARDGGRMRRRGRAVAGRAQRRRAQGRREGAHLRRVRGLPRHVGGVPLRLRGVPRARRARRSSTRCSTATAHASSRPSTSAPRWTSRTSSCGRATCSRTRRPASAGRSGSS